MAISAAFRDRDLSNGEPSLEQKGLPPLVLQTKQTFNVCLEKKKNVLACCTGINILKYFAYSEENGNMNWALLNQKPDTGPVWLLIHAH